MRQRKAPARAQGAALSRRRAGSNMDGCAAGPTQVLENSCTCSQEDQGTSWKGPACSSCHTGENEGLVLSIAYTLAMAVLSFHRCLSTGVSTLKEVITLKTERLPTILFSMSLAALAGAYCGTSLLMWMLWTKSVPQVLLEQLAADELRSLRNVLAAWGEQSQELQRLRAEVARLAAEMGAMKKEAEQMREAMSATTQMSDWALKSAGDAIDLQRSAGSPAWLCRWFGFLCAPPLLDTFVQVESFSFQTHLPDIFHEN
ncbi:uncharacterized protein LJ206_000679 [Theristicus caerulescens]